MYSVLKDFAGPVATIVASFAAVYVTAHFSSRQVEIASEKLRYDLFDRRLRIFESVFDFYRAMIAWEGTADQIEVKEQFFKSYQESVFLFGEDSQIAQTFDELNKMGARAIGLKESLKRLHGDPESQIKFHKEMTQIHTTGFDTGLLKLKASIGPYLNFHEFKSNPKRRFWLRR